MSIPGIFLLTVAQRQRPAACGIIFKLSNYDQTTIIHTGGMLLEPKIQTTLFMLTGVASGSKMKNEVIR